MCILSKYLILNLIQFYKTYIKDKKNLYLKLDINKWYHKISVMNKTT